MVLFSLKKIGDWFFFIAVIFDPTCLNQEQDKNWSQGLIWAQHIFLEYIQTLNTKSGTNLTLISLAPARTRKPRLRISSTHSEQRNLNNCFLTLFFIIQNLFSIFHLSPGAAKVAASIESKKTAFIIVADLLKFIQNGRKHF